jgi:C-terminal processing protease CtpA/Prc
MSFRSAVRSLAAALLLSLSWATAAAELPEGAPARLDRLARLWGEVRFRHPWILTRGADWDGALLATIPRVLDARTPADEHAALAAMLDALRDPGTAMAPLAATSPRPSPTTWRWEGDAVLVVRAGVPTDWESASEEGQRLSAEIEKAKGVVIDLRRQPPVVTGVANAGDLLDLIAPALSGGRSPRPQLRSVVHSGYRPQRGVTSGGYSTSLLTEPGDGAPPGGPGPSRRIAFVADRTSPITGLVPVLQAAGRAVLVAEGTPDDSYMGGTTVDLGQGLSAVVRVAEIDPPLRVDFPFPEGAGDAAIDRARAWVSGGSAPPAPALQAEAATLTWTPDRDWPEARPPSLPLRLLALIRLWNVIRFFDPYLALLDEPWDGQLARHAPAFAAAESAEAYELAVAALAARLQDTHVRVGGPELRERFAGRLAADVLLVEGRATVVRTGPAAAAAGLRVGDVIESVDGAPLLDRARALERTTAASNPGGLALITLGRALAGPAGSVARLEVAGSRGERRVLEIPRTRPQDPAPPDPPGDPWRLLDGNVGFVDLVRLTPAQVEPMLKALGSTDAIVFDLRGYPRGVVWTLAPRMRTRTGDVAALFRRRLVGRDGEGSVDGGWYAFAQPIGSSSLPPYRGRSVMLVDERTISQAEHTGLFLEAAAGTVFVGSQTAGANGDVTNLVLPGGVTVSFTGHDVRHADGRQLQRVGLEPLVRASPTVEGLRSGRDEVLEAALAFLRAKGTAPR